MALTIFLAFSFISSNVQQYGMMLVRIDLAIWDDNKVKISLYFLDCRKSIAIILDKTSPINDRELENTTFHLSLFIACQLSGN